jgi:hypothetical protein
MSIFYSRYAFVYHRTCQEAERNLRLPINYQLFGPACDVEYANDCSTLCNNHQIFDNKKLIVRRIPENIDENDLHNLFINCHVLKYYPATMMKNKSKNKILTGYE